MTPPCKTCNALCCQYFCFQIDTPDDYEEFEDIRWYLCHEGVSVHVEEDETWYIQIENPCKKLDNDNRCVIYEDRPLICRNYGETCEATGSDYGYLEEFKTPEQLLEYARKTLGKKTFEREMIKYRAKAAGVGKQEMRERLFKAKLLSNDAKKKKTKKNGKAGKKKAKS